MLITLTITNVKGGNGGAIQLKKVDMDGSKEMGEIHFEDSGEKDWLLMVLMERHPNVALIDEEGLCEGAATKPNEPCCFLGAMIESLSQENKDST
ncbi:MAG: hypothetical protein E4H30_03250 [Methanomassiliicoccus sp.]|nr:MAG: hypothetical protein E4H30_03250 [Methanomassiliicoccus sp.]